MKLLLGHIYTKSLTQHFAVAAVSGLAPEIYVTFLFLFTTHLSGYETET